MDWRPWSRHCSRAESPRGRRVLADLPGRLDRRDPAPLLGLPGRPGPVPQRDRLGRRDPADRRVPAAPQRLGAQRDRPARWRHRCPLGPVARWHRRSLGDLAHPQAPSDLQDPRGLQVRQALSRRSGPPGRRVPAVLQGRSLRRCLPGLEDQRVLPGRWVQSGLRARLVPAVPPGRSLRRCLPGLEDQRDLLGRSHRRGRWGRQDRLRPLDLLDRRDRSGLWSRSDPRGPLRPALRSRRLDPERPEVRRVPSYPSGPGGSTSPAAPRACTERRSGRASAPLSSRRSNRCTHRSCSESRSGGAWTPHRMPRVRTPAQAPLPERRVRHELSPGY
jgi:hypothetical protein